MSLPKIPIGVGFPLYKGVEYINEAIEAADKAQRDSVSAKTSSENAVNTANAAETKADSVQEQFNQVVIQGDSSVEAAQARVDAEGNVFPTLKDRMDNGDALLAERATSNDLLTSVSYPRLISHRGFRDAVPENTIPAFEMAGQLGYWGIECDVQTTSDGKWVVIHDLTVDKMTNGTGNVSDLSYSQIQSLVIDSGSNVAMYPNLKIPTFEEYLEVCKRYGSVPVIEIKEQSTAYSSTELDNFVSIIRSFGLENKCVMITSSFDISTEIRNRSGVIVIQPLALITQSNLDFVKSLGNAGIDTDSTKVTKQEIDLAHSQGILVNCFTGKNHADALRLADIGLDFITVDGVSKL